MEGFDIQQIVRTAIEEYLQARPEGSEDVMRMASIMAREALERAARQIMPPSANAAVRYSYDVNGIVAADGFAPLPPLDFALALTEERKRTAKLQELLGNAAKTMDAQKAAIDSYKSSVDKLQSMLNLGTLNHSQD